MTTYIDNLTWKENGKTVHSPGSNFWECEDGWILEIEFQAEKHIRCGKKINGVIVRRVGTKRGAYAAKQKGREFTLTEQQIKEWDRIKLNVMRELLDKKAKRSPAFREWLLESGDILIVEGNWWHDNFWGNCRCQNRDGKHPQCLKPGSNWLGSLLMDLRRVVEGKVPAR